MMSPYPFSQTIAQCLTERYLQNLDDNIFSRAEKGWARSEARERALAGLSN